MIQQMYATFVTIVCRGWFLGVRSRVMGARGDTEKLRNLILYLSKKSEDDDSYAYTKLNKLLFYVDFLSYARTGKAVTNEQYQSNRFGPTPRGISPVVRDMEDKGEIEVKAVKVPFYKWPQKRPEAVLEANLDILTPEEIALADEVLERFWGVWGKGISKSAYAEFGIDKFERGKTIPYSIALVDNREPTQDDIQWAIDRGLGKMARAWHNSRNAKSPQ